MLAHSVQSFRIYSFVVAACLLTSLPAAEAQQSDDAAEAYQKKQRLEVQKLRRTKNSLVTEKLHEEFIKIERDYRTLINSGVRGQSERNKLETGLRYEIYVLTEPDIQAKPTVLGSKFQTVLNRVGRAGTLILNANDKKRFRQIVCDIAIKHAEELLSNNLVARSLALELLLELEIVSPRGGARIQMHEDIPKLITGVLTDTNQPDAIKARAANCAKKYIEKANPIPQIQMAIANALADELRRPVTEVAYQDTLVATLERVTSARELVGQKRPVHFVVAMEVMQQRSRNILIRSRCARVLGRGGFDAQVNFDVLAWAVAQLTLEAALEFNQSEDVRTDPRWKRSAWYLYTAFHHEDRKEPNKGFLNRDSRSTVVREAYDNSIGIIAHMMFNDNKIPAGNSAKLFTWLKANVPGNPAKYDPTSPPLEIPNAFAQKQDG